MRTRSTLAVLLAALAAGCGSTSLKSRIVLAQPTSVAVFVGITSKNADLHPYAAIANGARDDLVLVDALDDKPVLAPIVVRALAIPTLTRPSMVVAGSLHDGGADLLAVIPQGTSIVQVVRTWTADNQVVDTLEVDVAKDAPGAEILSAISSPVPQAGSGEAAEGKVRLVLGLTGGRLAVLEYARDADGEAIDAPTAAEVRTVGFAPVALSPTPGDARLIYAATPDDLPAGSGRFGVVELGASGALSGWTLDLLPTVAPTRLVAAVQVAERIWADNDEEIPEGTPFVLRVFAALDPVGCNDDGVIPCGIVTVDPSAGVRGIAPDPLGELPWQLPVRMAAEPVAMLAAIPPAKTTGLTAGRFNIQTGLGVREATGAVAIAAANGRVYTLDAARRTIHNDNTMLRLLEGTTSQTRTRASGISYVARTQPKPEHTQILQLVLCTIISEAGGKVECKLDSSGDATDGIRVTPGYTRDDSFEVSWQGVLPAVNARSVDVGVEGAQLYAAVQLRTSAGIAESARVYDPALGVHVGDTFELDVNDLAEGADACDVPDDPATASIDEAAHDVHEFTISAILPPDATRFPGGALLLADDGSACYAALKAGHAGMTGSVRASGWLMKSNLLGYAGRPSVLASVERENLNDGNDLKVPPEPHTTGLDIRVLAELRYTDETALSCPLSPWPADPASVSCDAACRAQCERLSLARKARRWYTMPDACGDDTTCTALWGGPIIDPDPDNDPLTENPAISGNSTSPPNATGPVVSFRFTVRQRLTETSTKLVYPKLFNRDVGVKVATASGHTPTARYPLSGAVVMPTGMAAFDQSENDITRSYRFWVSYTDDVVMDFSPSQTINSPVSVR